jgi:alkanesulfonate monooxygenase SsuD/methylene tetrahydromethanopterin reductase-like flavin-dependent oxidoreductase (luciferase family)
VRFGQLREAIQIIPALWSGTAVSFTGEYYQLQNAICSPAPQPRPALILGALGPGVARLAGRHADGLNLHWHKRAIFPELFAALDAGLTAAGRTRAGFDLSLHPALADLGSDPRQTLDDWAGMGFTRAIVYLLPPYPLRQLVVLAAQTK